MAKRAKHSFVNTCIAIGLLVLVFTYGIFQTEDLPLCQTIGIVLHYLSLSVLLWMCVTISNMYERVSRSPSNELPDDELASDQPIQKPILGLYLVGWGVASIVCGISGAVNMREYASHSYCFLYSAPALSALFAPALILIIFLIIFFLLVRCAIRSSDSHGQLSEGTQATENVDLDLLEPNTSMDRHSYKSISSRTASSNIEDPEHCLNTQLKAHIIVSILFLTMWICGSLTARRVFKNIIPYDEHIFSISYSISAALLGAFIVFFYCVARNDVRGKWTFIKRSWCRNRSVSDTNACVQQNVNQSLTNPIVAASTSGYPVEINNSRSSSRTSSHTKSHNSNVLKAAVDLNSITLNDPNAEAKIANVNLVILHRQQYRTNNSLSYGSANGAEMFYNPHQSTVARKFFRKQRKNMMKHNNLGVRRRADGANSDNTSIVSSSTRNSSTMKMPHKDRLNSSNIFGSGAKVNNTNIHIEPVKEVKQQNKNILSDSGDESETLIGHVAGPTVNRLISESEHLRNSGQSVYNRNNDGSPKKRPHDINIIEEQSIAENMRTVSQQCSLEYSSESPQDIDIENEIDQKIDDLDSTVKKSSDEENVTVENLVNADIDEISACSYNDREHLECSLTPENNEGMYSLADLDGNLISDNNDLYNTDEGSFNMPSIKSYEIQEREYDSPTNITCDNSEKAESVTSHGIYPQMPRAIYENPLHSHIHGRTSSTTTLDSDVLFNRYQISEASANESITSDCDECEDTGRIATSPVSTGEIDEIYGQINRPKAQIGYREDEGRLSPVLFPPNISLESGLNEIEINTDFRFNTQGILTSSRISSGSSRSSSLEIESDKKETTV